MQRGFFGGLGALFALFLGRIILRVVIVTAVDAEQEANERPAIAPLRPPAVAAVAEPDPGVERHATAKGAVTLEPTHGATPDDAVASVWAKLGGPPAFTPGGTMDGRRWRVTSLDDGGQLGVVASSCDGGVLAVVQLSAADAGQWPTRWEDAKTSVACR